MDITADQYPYAAGSAALTPSGSGPVSKIWRSERGIQDEGRPAGEEFAGGTGCPFCLAAAGENNDQRVPGPPGLRRVEPERNFGKGSRGSGGMFSWT